MKLPSLLNLEEEQARPLSKWRNIIAFWIIGLTNNYPYVIMLSAAYDIVHRLSERNHNTPWTAINPPLTTNHSISSSACASPRDGNHSYLCEKAGTSVSNHCEVVRE